MAANKTIGGINVTITATTDRFQKNLTAARRMIGAFTKSIKGLVFNLKTLGVALAVGGLTKLVANQFEAINALKDLADKTGVSTDKLAGLQLAAEEAGISNTLLEKSLVKLNNEMGMAGDVALREWIEKTSKLTTQQEKLAAATEMFGARGSDMVRFLNGGTAALDEAQKAAESMGLAITQDVAIGVDRASEAFARFKMSVTGIFRALAGEIAPFVELLSMKASSFLSSNGQGKGIGTFIADVIVEMAKNVVDLIQSMVGGVLAMVAEVHGLVFNFRISDMGKRIGMGFGSTAAGFAASDAWADAAKRRDQFQNGPRWSAGIQSFVDDARKQSADAAAKWKASLGGPDILDMVGGFAKNMLGPTAQSWMGAAKGLGGGIAQRFGWMAQAAGMMKAPSATAQRPALSFAESGSVESYRQQAAIRSQRDSMKLDKDRNGLLKEILGAVKNPVMPVARLT
jgi:hypothetical protein